MAPVNAIHMAPVMMQDLQPYELPYHWQLHIIVVLRHCIDTPTGHCVFL